MQSSSIPQDSKAEHKERGGWPTPASLFLFFFLAISILGILPNQKVYVAKIFLTQWFLAGMVTFFFLKNKWLRTFLVWVTIRMAMDYKHLNNSSLFIFFSIILGLLFYQFVQNHIKKKDLLDILCVIGLMQLVYVVVQILGYDAIFKPGPFYKAMANLNTGFMGNTNLSGILLAVCIPAFFRKGWAWFLPLFAYPLYKVDCTTAIFALAVGVIFCLYQHHRIIWPLFVFSPIALWLGRYKLMTIMDGPRIRLWTSLSPLLKDRPFVGQGIGQYRYVSGPVISTVRDTTLFNWSTAHCDPLQIYITAGAIALVILACYLIFLYCLRCSSIILSTIVLVGLTCSLGSFVFYTPMGLIVLAAAAILDRKEGQYDY